jgi:hypothetical protein
MERETKITENISIAIRYVKNGKVFESLLGIYTTKELDAKNFTDLTLDIMEKNNLDTSRLLSHVAADHPGRNRTSLN